MAEKISSKSMRSAGSGTVFQHGKLYPSVSILLPVNNQYPQWKEAEQRLKSIVKEAETILNTELAEEVAKPIIMELRKVLTTIDFTHLSESLAIFVSSDIQKVVHLSIPVEEKLIIGSTFELRDLFFAAKVNFYYLVLTISENMVRLFLGEGNHIREVQNDKMPAGIRDIPGEGNSPEELFESFTTSKSVSEADYYSNSRLIKYLRIIDNQLSELIKPKGRKVIVCAVQKEISAFMAISENKDAIIGTVEGNFDYINEVEVFNKIKTVLIEKLKKDQEANLRLLDEAINKNTLVTGIENVWRAVLEKKGRLLFVEKDYRSRGRVGKDKYTLITDNNDGSKTNKNTDLVDDLIEYTFEFGGDVAFLENGSLSEHGRIALLIYYSE